MGNKSIHGLLTSFTNTKIIVPENKAEWNLLLALALVKFLVQALPGYTNHY